ncbi:DoxX family protein [Shimazuella alba]|uniref:DoxX family membrane protein n=1 Tax=Shimazuella alba TaxID=2690964 RepID=A0A6I4VVR5_9BACL|nr:DoxX family protein [Shimazuella alba]MXQ53936.1 DoxX family membrane protein [Shimazuella alba]
MFIFSIVLQSLLIAYYIFSGVNKIAGAKYWVDVFNQIKLPHWFRVVTGYVQLVGATMLIIGYWFEGAVIWGGIWLGITMIGAIIAHIRVKDPFSKTAAAIVFLVLIIILVTINADSLFQPFS